MVHYDKKVIYLSEMEYGNRIKGAGFVRMECRGESCSFDMHVSGMKALAERKYDIVAVSVWGKECLIGKIFLRDGSGEWKEVYEKGRVTETDNGDGRSDGEDGFYDRAGGREKEGIAYKEIAEILVKISDTKALVGKAPGREKVMQAAELAVGEMADGVREKEEENIGGNGGIWRFVRGGRNQMDGEEKADRQDGTEGRKKGNGIYQMMNGERGGEETAYGTGRKMMPEDSGRETRWENVNKEMGRENVNREVGKENRSGRGGGSREKEATWKSDEREIRQRGNKRQEAIGLGMEQRREEGDNSVNKGGMLKGIGKKDKKETEGEVGKKIQIDDVILNDKWDQLKKIYSVVHPYEDDRQYIAIQPKDFVIMTGDCQHLANNSFLLHGFYNYRHIVLGREQDGSFYLGVPGVYYEREKMVALMFGFEAFECTGGKAEAGKFGYYLRKVKI